MADRKTLCPIHSFYYTGSKCPLCEKERIDRYANKYAKADMVRHDKEDREINEADLDRLVNKFNRK